MYRFGVALNVEEAIELDCRDPELLARFWCEVLDFVVIDRENDGSLEIGPLEGSGAQQPTTFLSKSDEPKLGKLRLHIDVNATDRDQDAELERLLSRQFERNERAQNAGLLSGSPVALQQCRD